MKNATVISTQSLSKHFGRQVAVNRVSIHVQEGEIYGFVGLNGAGKSTTIRCLLGMLRPTEGSAFLFGEEVRPGRGKWNEVGCMVEEASAYPNLSVKENLEVYYRLHRMRDHSRIGEMIGALRLGPYRNRQARHLSTGNRQRLGLARALLHHPRLLVLDEPVNGLDPAGIVEVREMLRGLARQGTTIFLSSHILLEISRLADRVGIIHEGELLRELDTAALEQQLNKRLLIKTKDPGKTLSLLAQQGLQGVTDKGFISVKDPGAIRDPANVATLLVGAGLPPAHLSVEEEDLEQFFLRIIGKEGSHE